MKKKRIIYLIILLVIIICIVTGLVIYNKVSNRIGRIELYLHDSSNQPVIGATVNLRKEDGFDIGKTETGRDGKINYYNVKEGNYVIDILEMPEGYDIESNKENKLEVKDDTVTTIDIECKRTAGLLVLQILNSNNEPMKDVGVCIYDEEGYLLSTIYSDSDGKIYKNFLEDGTYYFRQDEEQENIEKEALDLTMYKVVLDEENRTFYKTINNKI